MSIVIKYMDLPKSCSNCPFCVQKYATDEDDVWGDMCLAMAYKTWEDDRMVDNYEDEDGEYHDFDIETGRHPDCPMRERKGHETESEVEKMTQEIFDKATHLDHDITVLKNIKFEQDKNHWVGFRTPSGEESSFWNGEIRNDFKNFINSELEKAQKLLQEL